MPRLHGAANANPFNYYDALPLSAIWRDGTQSGGYYVFGNSNVGNHLLCNLQVAGYIAFDQTAYIQNVYARLNFDDDAVTRQWLHATYAEIIIADRALKRWSLFDLVRTPPMRPEAKPFVCPHCGGDVELDVLKSMSVERVNAYPEQRPSNDVEDVTIRKVWIVPVRQRFSMNILLEPQTTKRLLEAVSRDIIPEPCIWLHIEGLSRRDVC